MWQQQQKHFSYHMQSPIKWKTAHMFLAINSVGMLVQAEWCPQSGKPWTRHHQVHRADKAAQTQRHSSLWGDNSNFQAQQWMPVLLPFLSIHFPSKKFFKFAFYVKEKSASVDKGMSFNQVANHFQKLILYIHSLGQNP